MQGDRDSIERTAETATASGAGLSADGMIVLRGHLEPGATGRTALFATLGAFRAAASHCEAAGRELGTTSNALLHQRCYSELRRTSGLPANLVIRAIAVAARRLKEPSDSLPELEYDSRVARLHAGYRLDLATITGRLVGVPLVPAEDSVKAISAQADLIRLALAPDAAGVFRAQLILRLSHLDAADGRA